MNRTPTLGNRQARRPSYLFHVIPAEAGIQNSDWNIEGVLQYAPTSETTNLQPVTHYTLLITVFFYTLHAVRSTLVLRDTRYELISTIFRAIILESPLSLPKTPSIKRGASL